MKIFKTIIILSLLSSCSTIDSQTNVKTKFKKEIKDNNIIHFENKEHNEKFDRYLPFIENLVQETIEKANTIYKLEYLDVYVRCKKNDWIILPHLGVGGQWLNEHTIQVIINIDFFDSESLLTTNIERILLHELGHTIHYKNRTRTGTLFEAIISEGFADHIEGLITGLEPNVWSISLDNEELEHYMELAKKELWSTNFDYNKWFFGTPVWIGYSLGYKIIGDYMNNNPNMKIIDIIKLPDSELYSSIN